MGIRWKGAYQRKIPVNANSHVQIMVLASPSLILKMLQSSQLFCTGAVTNPSAHLKTAGSTQPSHQPTAPAQPSLCKMSECQEHQLNYSRF